MCLNYISSSRKYIVYFLLIVYNNFISQNSRRLYLLLTCSTAICTRHTLVSIVNINFSVTGNRNVTILCSRFYKRIRTMFSSFLKSPFRFTYTNGFVSLLNLISFILSAAFFYFSLAFFFFLSFLLIHDLVLLFFFSFSLLVFFRLFLVTLFYFIFLLFLFALGHLFFPLFQTWSRFFFFSFSPSFFFFFSFILSHLSSVFGLLFFFSSFSR